MNDYIRKAVELADGWDGDLVVTVTAPEYDEVCGWWQDELPQYVLDALAAQLVRQVDATEYKFLASRKWAEVREPMTAHCIGSHRSDDRTMNTIRAILDSGVLEND